MAQRNLRNLLVPAPGDPIMTSLSQTLAEAGVYVPVASAAAARLLLTQMETAGQTPTPVLQPNQIPLSNNPYGSLSVATLLY